MVVGEYGCLLLRAWKLIASQTEEDEMPRREARLFLLHPARSDLRLFRNRGRRRGVAFEEYGRRSSPASESIASLIISSRMIVSLESRRNWNSSLGTSRKSNFIPLHRPYLTPDTAGNLAKTGVPLQSSAMIQTPMSTGAPSCHPRVKPSRAFLFTLIFSSVTNDHKRGQPSEPSNAELFLTFCNSQPLPLFAQSVSLASLRGRDPELLLAMDAHCIRFRGLGIKDREIELEIKAKTERASRLVIDRLADGSVELSTIQALCLLSLLEFTGKVSNPMGDFWLTDGI